MGVDEKMIDTFFYLLYFFIYFFHRFDYMIYLFTLYLCSTLYLDDFDAIFSAFPLSVFCYSPLI